MNTKNHGKYRVISINKTDKHHVKWYNLKFVETGFETVKSWNHIKEGAIKDYLKPNSVYGAGCLGEGYVSGRNKKEMNIWRGMLGRCYSASNASYKRYGGNDVSVSDRWLIFSNFLEDIPMIEGYNKDLFEKGLIHLDKDLKQINSSEKVYSLETCVFLTRSENAELAMKDSMRENVKGYNPNHGVVKIDNCNQFSKEYGFHSSGIYSALDGEISGTSGWVFTQNENESDDELVARWNHYFKNSQKMVKAGDVVYKSISEASRSLGLSRDRIKGMVACGEAEYVIY